MRAGPRLILLWLAVLLLAASGCGTLSQDELQREFGATVRQRLLPDFQWQAAAPEERSGQERIDRLLAQELTAERAVAIALLNNRDLRAEMARAQVARADLVQAGLLENPALGYAQRFGGAGHELELSFFADFLNLFTLAARRTLAGGELQRARLSLAQRAIELAAEVKQQYYTLVADQQLLELAGQVVDATEAAAELAARQQAAGTLSLREQALQQSFFAQAALEAARQEAGIAADREKLNRLLGLWGSQAAWSLPARLPEVPERLPALQELEGEALRQRLDLAARRAEVENAHLALGYARQSSWLTLLGLGLGFKRDPDGARSIGPDLEFGLPLFDRGQGRIPRLEAQLAEAESHYAQLAIEVRAEVRASTARLVAVHAQLRHYRQAILPLAQRVVDETLKFYNGMLLGVYELLSAKQTQIDAARDYIALWRDFWIAWGELERAQGKAMPAAAPPAPTPAASANAPALPEG